MDKDERVEAAAKNSDGSFEVVTSKGRHMHVPEDVNNPDYQAAHLVWQSAQENPKG